VSAFCSKAFLKLAASLPVLPVTASVLLRYYSDIHKALEPTTSGNRLAACYASAPQITATLK